MVAKVWAIARLHLQITFNDRAAFIFGFVLPLIFTFIIGQAISGFSEDGPPSWPLAVVNEDGGVLSERIVRQLDEDETLRVTTDVNQEGALASLADNDVVAVLVIPAGFADAVAVGDTVALDFHSNPEALQTTQLVQEAVNLAISQAAGVLTSAQMAVGMADNLGLFEDDVDGSQAEKYVVTVEEQSEIAWQAPPILVDEQQVSRLTATTNSIPAGLSQSSPGLMVVFAMFFVLGGTAVLVQEREEGTLRRLVVMPLSKGAIIFGKLLGVYISGVIQIAILVLAGQFLFGVNWGQSPLALTLMVLSFAFAITSLGMLIAAMVRTLAQANSLPTIIILPMSALGGAMWPIEITPTWMQQLGHLFPTAWAMDGFHDIITRGLGLTAVLPEVFILVGYGILFLVIGIWRFRYE